MGAMQVKPDRHYAQNGQILPILMNESPYFSSWRIAPSQVKWHQYLICNMAQLSLRSEKEN
jgi:hypothetical protein